MVACASVWEAEANEKAHGAAKIKKNRKKNWIFFMGCHPISDVFSFPCSSVGTPTYFPMVTLS